MEEWLEIEDFPGYEVSSEGRIRNGNTGLLLGIHDNGHGVKQVVMRRDGRNNARAVHKLVALAYLDPAPDDCVPIHLDGDWNNNAVDNLDWKPRWFAVKRTLQNKRTTPNDDRPVRFVKTGEVYDNSLECARDIGGFEDLVILTAQNRYGATYLGSLIEFVYD